MADLHQVIQQLADTRAVASASSAANQTILDAEIAKPISDPAIMTPCIQTLRENDITIKKCDDDIGAAILARDGVDAFLSTLSDLTGTMDTQTKALKADQDGLNKAKDVATSIAGLLSPFLPA